MHILSVHSVYKWDPWTGQHLWLMAALNDPVMFPSQSKNTSTHLEWKQMVCLHLGLISGDLITSGSGKTQCNQVCLRPLNNSKNKSLWTWRPYTTRTNCNKRTGEDKKKIFSMVSIDSVMREKLWRCILGRFEIPVNQSLWFHAVEIRDPLRTLQAPAHGVRCSVVRKGLCTVQHCQYRIVINTSTHTRQNIHSLSCGTASCAWTLRRTLAVVITIGLGLGSNFDPTIFEIFR